MLFSKLTTNGSQFFYLAPGILLFPLLGLLITLIFGGRMGQKTIGWVASSAVLLSLLVAILQAISLFFHPEGQIIPLAEWISIGDLNIRWSIQVDSLSTTMMLVVAGVGSLIHIYAIAYMGEDVQINGDPTRYRRFFVFFNLFILMMMILVSADNYLMLFVGWEGVGLCSYLLIGFWYDKGENGIGNAIAGKKAFIVNRIGDFGFLIAALMIFALFRTFDFNQIFEQLPGVPQGAQLAILMITLFMLVGVTGKSSQIPLYVWLPDAMAGPTPVSALIHAATMVTAGVYLIARSHPLYVLVPAAQNTVALVGALTALLAATIAVAQFDIKKVLAYSTISQLGFMVAAVGMGAFTAGMFHLVTHAFFKALLFLSAGSVILGVEHGLHHLQHHKHASKGFIPDAHDFDPQDMRNMGGLRHRMRTTFWVYLVGALALSGIFPLAGFWSKDEILAEASLLNQSVYWLLTIAAFFTAFYMGRQVLMVFFGQPRTQPAAQAQENPPLITYPLIALAALSALGGLFNLPGLHTFGHWLEHTLEIEAKFKAIHLEYAAEKAGFNLNVALISTGLALLAIFISYIIYYRRYPEFLKIPPKKRTDDPLRGYLGAIFTAMNHKWWVDELYQLIIIRPYLAFARFLAIVVDWRFWHDWFHDVVIAGGFRWFTRSLAINIDLGIIDAFANAIGSATQWVSSKMRLLQSGYVRNYALAVVLGVVCILGFLIIR
jgi:NADH-quinone oxidoreductase subunit L